jgi:hypothetical protein
MAVTEERTDEDERLARIEALCAQYPADLEQLAALIASVPEHVRTARRHADECLRAIEPEHDDHARG